MSKRSARSVIRLRGVRHNNLKNFDLDLPLNRLIVVTGLSGSGKSSLAFDTLFAEGQRRYIETFSPYARQFLDRMDKPQVDSIEGIPPAIAIEQRNSVRTTRSTVGTMTEICDYMKLLWPQVAQLHCRQCGKPVRQESPQQIWDLLAQEPSIAPANSPSNQVAPEFLVTFGVPLSEKLSLSESLDLVAKQGYQRLLVAGNIVRLEAAAELLNQKARKSSQAAPLSITVVQDRLKLSASARARFIEACEQAYHFGKGKLSLYRIKTTPGALAGPEGDARPAVETPGNGSPAALIGQELRFSNRLHCAPCDIEYREPSPALFSFNHPVGACPTCRGFGRVISIDYHLALPDRSKTLAQGVVKPWQSGMSAECQDDLMKMCRRFGVPTQVPFEKLAKKWQDLVLEGEPGYGRDDEHRWPRAWYGLKGYFRWLESKAYKMHVRVLLSRYRAYTPCPVCAGQRFQPEALLYRVGVPETRAPGTGIGGNSNRPSRNKGGAESLTLAAFYQLPIRRAVQLVESLQAGRKAPPNDPVTLALNEVRSRLAYLNDVGLGYLTLDRPTRSLSGGETERVSLTTCLGTRLVNTLFVLDEPSVGLHPRDTERLIKVLEQLRDSGNTVLVVEHEASVMHAADQIVDLGPGHGATGGQIVFQGPYADILHCSASLTGQYLSGRRSIEIPDRRPVALEREGRHRRTRPDTALQLNEAAAPFSSPADPQAALRLSGATLHNLHDVSVVIPLKRFVCITGVSGSGKTTLIREILLPELSERLRSALPTPKASDRLAQSQTREQPGNSAVPGPAEGDNRQHSESAGEEAEANTSAPRCATLEGWQPLARVVLVDQSILGKTPRSNPAVYIGAFEEIRELFAQSDLARRRGLNASAFSFNSAQGQCERCRGAGFEKIEMQFLSDVYIRCPECDGRRYRPHILEVKLTPPPPPREKNRPGPGAASGFSIADLLEATVDEAIEFLRSFPDSRPAQRAVSGLKLLQETGLGYLKLGQPINTLSGGESQRLKLVKHLAESLPPAPAANGDIRTPAGQSPAKRQAEIEGPKRLPPATPTLFLFDEPTTGLHFEDVRVLLKVFQRLVDAGHSVVVIEHNLDVIKSADWLIDLGPEAGDLGGRVVAQGTPEQVTDSPESLTGQALRGVLCTRSPGSPAPRRAGISAPTLIRTASAHDFSR